MVAKTTSGSGFDIRFLFYVCDLVKNAINIDIISPTLFEIFGVKVQIFKSYLNELEEFPTHIFLIFCGSWAPLSMCPILVKSLFE